MKNLKFYTKEAICVVLHLCTKVDSFEIDNNDKIYEKLEEYNISETNIRDFDIDLDNSLVSLYLQEGNKEIMFYNKSYKDSCPEIPVGSYLVLDTNMVDSLNKLDYQKAFSLGDEIEVEGVSYDLTNQEILYRLNTYVVIKDIIDIVFDNSPTSEENEI